MSCHIMGLKMDVNFKKMRFYLIIPNLKLPGKNQYFTTPPPSPIGLQSDHSELLGIRSDVRADFWPKIPRESREQSRIGP